MTYMLESIITVPDRPIAVPSDDEFGKSETEQGFRFPSDYKAFLHRFGSGVIGDFIYIWNPGSAVPRLNWRTEVSRTLNAFRELVSGSPDAYKAWQLYPAEGGLLPCGHTGNSDVICWVTSCGNPDQWSIAVYGGEPSLWKYGESLTEFLVRCMRIPGHCEPFGDMTGERHVFRPLPQSL